MISNNKILTVSYGTFSCTLEGFDDSFHTMKAIAEYFRDLASDDRYFGAEPPQPDAEMLARIAEREIARRVEARMNEGRIFLSATAPQAEAPLAPQAAPAPAAAPVAEAAPQQAAPEVTPDIAPEAMDAEPEAVQVQDAAPEADVQQGDGIDDAFDHAKAGDMLQTAPEAQVEDELDDTDAFFADPIEDTTETVAEEDEQPEIAQAEAVESTPRDRVIPHADSIAAKLERIRAVVSQADDDDQDDDYSEDEHAEELVSDAAPADDDYEDEDDAQSAQDDALMAAMMAQADDEGDAARDDSAADLTAQAAADVSAALDEDDAMTMAEDEDDGDVAEILARLDDQTSDEDDDTATAHVAMEDDGDGDVSDDLSDDSDDMNLFDDSDDADEDDEEIMIVEEEDSAEDAAAPAPRITRIVKVKRSELEAAIAQGNLEEMSDEDEDDTDAQADGRKSSLSDEDEDALLRELADVEAGLDGEDDAEEAARATHAARTAAAKLDDAADDGDVDRLMAKTDAEMGEPESARRRDAFAHLRAAVAAKNSDDGIVGAKLAEDALEVRAYQTDLADVVKPRRPEARGTSRDRRPDVQRPAPLKLVAEQRVDTVQPAALTTPVRPRRVEQPVAVAEVNTSTSFAEFADDMGAHELPDLLEAAAAYLAFVEERDQFSRPQLMTKVRQVIGTEFSREDGLRSFGQLLRAGKIEKIKGGRFAVSGDIGFRPDQRAAG